MVIGQGSIVEALSEDVVAALIGRALSTLALDGRKVLVIIPDGTRTAPIPMLFRLLHAQIGRHVDRLDYLIALGTHPPLTEPAIDQLVGVSAVERASRYPNVSILNHRWDQAETLTRLGTLCSAETAQLTDGRLAADVPVTLNRLILDYDQILICGPVFPHEVAGYSGGAKYLFPGIAGPDIIHFTHWLGALVTSLDTIGVKETPVRRIIERAAEFVPKPILCLALALKGPTLHGLFIGPHQAAWSAAADLSAQLNVVYTSRQFASVLSMPAPIYDDLWTAAKAMYKTEPIIADGGEVIVYALHIHEVSITHGALIDAVGYHVRDYFVKQWDRFKHIPGGILAHSTHVKGQGGYDVATGIETPRIRVTLATGIPEARCKQINLGYLDPRTIDPAAWAGREAEGRLRVEHAGEVLYRLGS